ncbi:MAG: PEP-CTERM sorting domain-containing protein [Planctomycetota bacterium]|jgi:hypothetical protein
MKLQRPFWVITILVFLSCSPGNLLQATSIYPLEVFSSNGGYYNSPNLDMSVVVSEGVGVVDFTFYNESLVDCSLARIYFDDGPLLGIASITNGPGTFFSQPTSPNDLPNGNLLDPPFETTNEFCIDGDPPLSDSGVNPVDAGEPLEWVRIIFNRDGEFSNVTDALNTGALRIGVHVIAFPDGSSESAVTTPEPLTLSLLGLGVLVFLRKRRA